MALKIKNIGVRRDRVGRLFQQETTLLRIFGWRFVKADYRTKSEKDYDAFMAEPLKCTCFGGLVRTCKCWEPGEKFKDGGLPMRRNRDRVGDRDASEPLKVEVI